MKITDRKITQEKMRVQETFVQYQRRNGRTADDLARPAAGTKGDDSTDLVSVVRVILHYKRAHATFAAPTELVSVE